MEMVPQHLRAAAAAQHFWSRNPTPITVKLKLNIFSLSLVLPISSSLAVDTPLAAGCLRFIHIAKGRLRS